MFCATAAAAADASVVVSLPPVPNPPIDEDVDGGSGGDGGDNVDDSFIKKSWADSAAAIALTRSSAFRYRVKNCVIIYNI